MRTLVSSILFVSASLAIAQTGRAPKGGDMAGNGGGVVVCGEPSGAELDRVEAGVYSNDYMQTRDSQDFINPESLEESFEYVDRLLSSRPQMQAQFRVYRKLIGNEKIDVGNRIWKSSNSKLAVIDDHDSVRQLPANCLPSDDRPLLGLYQLIVRKVTGAIVNYEVHAPTMEKLRKIALQVSMIYVHEWLWDFVKSDQAYMTRQLNAALHDKNTTPEDIALMIEDYGMVLSVKEPILRQNTDISAAVVAEKPSPKKVDAANHPYYFRIRMGGSLQAFVNWDPLYKSTNDMLRDTLWMPDHPSKTLTASELENAADLLVITQSILSRKRDDLSNAWWQKFVDEEEKAGRPINQHDWAPLKKKFEDDLLEDITYDIEACRKKIPIMLSNIRKRQEELGVSTASVDLEGRKVTKRSP